MTTKGEKFTFIKTAEDEEMEKKMEKTFVHITKASKGKRGP